MINIRYKLVADRLIKTFEGSFIFVLYANIYPESSSFIYALSIVGMLTAFSSVPNINPYLQLYANTRDSNLPISYAIERGSITVVIIIISAFFFLEDTSFSSLFLVFAMTCYSAVQFFYLNDNLEKNFFTTLFITSLFIVAQLSVIYFSFGHEMLFLVKGCGYLVLLGVLICRSEFSFPINLFKKFSIKDQVLLYSTGCVYGVLLNYDMMHFSGIESEGVDLYFTAKKAFDFIFVMFTWWGITLPERFVGGFDFKQAFLNLIKFILLIVCSFLTVYFCLSSLNLDYYWISYFVLLPVVFILDVFFTRYAIYCKVNHLELIKFSCRLFGVYVSILFFDVPLYIYPLVYFFICLLSYLVYLRLLLVKINS